MFVFCRFIGNIDVTGITSSSGLPGFTLDLIEEGEDNTTIKWAIHRDSPLNPIEVLILFESFLVFSLVRGYLMFFSFRSTFSRYSLLCARAFDVFSVHVDLQCC